MIDWKMLKYIDISATKIVLIMLITAIIVLNFLGIQVEEPLKTVTLMVVSFYFGQKFNSNTDNVKLSIKSDVAGTATPEEQGVKF